MLFNSIEFAIFLPNFDFSNSIKDVSYFFDADHLNKKGAKEYSNTLNKIINNMDNDL